MSVLRRKSSHGSRSTRMTRIEAVLHSDPQNKRCVDCHARSPQYVVCTFGVFVCARCSGVHTSFGHRVKGITLSEFDDAEVEGLAGNEAFSKVYLGKLPADRMKPCESSLDEVKRWIEDVYVKKKYYTEPSVTNSGANGAGLGSAPVRPAYLDISEDEIAVVPLSDLLGANTPILRVESTGAEEARRVAEEIARKRDEEDAARKAAEDAMQVDLLGGWDPFGVEEKQVVEREDGEAQEKLSQADGELQREPEPAPVVPSFQDEWATFVDDVGDQDGALNQVGERAPEEERTRERTPEERVISVANTTANQTVRQEVKGGLAPESVLQPGAAEMNKLQSAAVGTSATKPARTVPPPVPLEAFFPEFEEIRRTGVLPTGVPDPTRPQMPPPRAPSALNASLPAHEQMYRDSQRSSTSVPPPKPTSVARTHPSKPSVVPSVMPSAADRAGKTLGFGHPIDGGYDLRAVHAPKASESGNPFA